MSIIETFDDTSEAILKPTNIVKRVDGFPEIVIVTFSERVLDVMLKNYQSKVISSMIAGFEHLIYKTEYAGREIAFYMTSIGAPATVGLLEEILIKGGRRILLFGSCGSLDNNITDGHIAVPTHAYRDEGTSYHYVSSTEGEYIKVKTAKRTFEILKELNVPTICGRTWTTDAIYRETRRNMELRKDDGCITVEMECASIMAFAQNKIVTTIEALNSDTIPSWKWERAK